MADLSTYPEPGTILFGDAFLPDPPADRPRPNYGPKDAPPAQNAHNGDSYGDDYNFWQQGLSPVKLSVQTQFILAIVIVTIVVTLVVIFA